MQLTVLDERKVSHGEHHQSTFTPRLEVDLDAVRRRLARNVAGEVRFDSQTQALYAQDGSNYRQVPMGVVVPRTEDDVVAALAICREHGVPLMSRGSGTSLAGQSCNAAVILDFHKYLNRILDIDPRSKTARVQPGVVLDDLRNAANRRYGLTFAPDPSTHYCATLGGMIGNNACGVHSLMTCRTHRLGEKEIEGGRTSDCVRAMEVLTYGGSRLSLGDTSDQRLSELARSEGEIGRIFRTIAHIRSTYGDMIRERYPAIPRRVSGYNLDDLLPENNCNVARALAGSEGTLAVMLEAELQLVEAPQAYSLLVVGYESVYEAADHVMEIRKLNPVGLEGIDHRLVGFMEKKHLHPRDVQLLPDGKGFLYIEFGGHDQADADRKVRECREILSAAPDPPVDMKTIDDPDLAAHLWEVRESGLAATAWVPGMPDTWPGWEDAAVPPERLGDYLRDFRQLLNHYDYGCALYGHFGQGCIHTRIDFSLHNKPEVTKFEQFLEDASDLVVRYGGAFSAEHGDGQGKAMFLPKIFGDELIDAMRQFKRAWDPDWRMNPGKVIDPHSPTSNMRLGADYDPWEPETYFHFRDDHGKFSRAALRCVGVGKCLRTEDTFMCPSYLVTHEEADTTRGRARALFEMMRGDETHTGWRNHDVRGTLDLCLGCKGCKIQCPVSVDMARYKSEFLSHYYEGHLLPRSAYSMGLIELWARLGSLAPSLANLVGQTEPLSAVAKALGGVGQERHIPPFAKETFSAWYRRHRQTPQLPVQKAVVLYPDVFNDHFQPDVLIAATEVLEHFGFQVIVPDRRLPAIRPLLHFGMLPSVLRQMRHALGVLAPYAAAGVPIVGCEPSTVSCFRDEMGDLLPDDPDAEIVASRFQMLGEVLKDEDLDDLPKLNRQAILHVHCHQKAVLKRDGLDTLLDRLGLDVHEPQETCCGMAGAFGLEAEHVDVSNRIGEIALLPHIRDADPDTLILADGFSCRDQVREGTGREAMHIAQLLRLAIRQEPLEHYPERQAVESRTASRLPAAAALTAIALGGLAAGLLYQQRRRRSGALPPRLADPDR